MSLVLSRFRDETIMIGDDIEVTIFDIRGDRVRVGVDAPKEISVHRKEVWDAIRREQQFSPSDSPERAAFVMRNGVRPAVRIQSAEFRR